jgi:tetratricopeptide (TPR) repeat protein
MAQEHRSLGTLAAALGVAALLGGCSLLAPRPSPPTAPSPQPQSSRPQSPGALSSGSTSANPPPAAPPAPAIPQAPPRENHLSAATHSLVTQARTQMSHGDLDGASATLDRALRIEPNNPLLWIELGRLRIAEGDAHQAEGCGRKALALASGDRGTQAQAGRLLADALRAQGRNPEAIEVERQPFMH